ncbi:MAG: hypothetical protein Q9190_006687 [Brigantiaea leucoxantha]
MGPTMSSCEGHLGFDSFREMLHEEPAAANNFSSRQMWRTLEVNFGIAAACLPSIYPGYRALRRRIDKYCFKTEQTQTQSGKAQIWLNAGRTMRDTTPTATSTAGNSVDPKILIPEAAILMSTDVHFQHRAKYKDSAEQLMEGAEPAARWESWGRTGSEGHGERSVEHAKTSIDTNSLV